MAARRKRSSPTRSALRPHWSRSSSRCSGTLLARELDAAILRATLGGVVGGFGRALTLAVCHQPVAGDLEPAYESVAHRGTPPLREVKIGRIAAEAIRVSFDAQLPRRVMKQRVGDFLEDAFRLRPDRSAGEPEVDAVDVGAPALGQLTLQRDG